MDGLKYKSEELTAPLPAASPPCSVSALRLKSPDETEIEGLQNEYLDGVPTSYDYQFEKHETGPSYLFDKTNQTKQHEAEEHREFDPH